MSLEHAGPAATEARPAVTAGAVLDAALTLFAELGYHGTAVSQIAASLGIRTSSLYNHTRSKQDLLEAIIGRTVDGVLDDFRTAVDGLSDPVERLRRATRVYALRHATHRREALVANRDTTSLPEPARTRIRRRRRHTRLQRRLPGARLVRDPRDVSQHRPLVPRRRRPHRRAGCRRVRGLRAAHRRLRSGPAITGWPGAAET
jgi:AcrR family transcriptional regulator